MSHLDLLPRLGRRCHQPGGLAEGDADERRTVDRGFFAGGRLASIGLILPAVVDVAPVLVAWAALGLMLIMTGAATVRIVRREWSYLLGDLGFFALAAFVAWGGFGPEPFVG